MACRRCSSDKQRKFDVEMNFHFPGYEDLGKRAVLVFPTVMVCLDCGFAEFVVPGGELRILAGGTADA